MAKKSDTDEKLNISQIARRFGIARDRARQLMEGTQPASTRGQTRYYRLHDVLTAMKRQRREGQDEKRQAEIRRIQAQAEKLEFDLDQARGKYIEVDRVCEDLQTARASQRSILSQRLLNEYPSQVAGLSPEQVRVYSKRLFDQICQEMQRLAEGYKS